MNGLTVGKLRALTADLDPDTWVLIATPDWFVHVQEAISPTVNEDFVALTLFPGDEFDVRRDL